MLRHIMKGTTGWWVLHLLAVSLTFLLGRGVRFP